MKSILNGVPGQEGNDISVKVKDSFLCKTKREYPAIYGGDETLSFKNVLEYSKLIA